MTTYTCKCGKQFEGRGDSVTTGYRIPRAEYVPEHYCFGCPFVKEVNAEFLECRGTRNTPIYETTASCVSSKSSTLHVSSLNFDFIRDMQNFYNALGVEGPKDPPEPGTEDSSGRLQFSFTFPKNAKGEKAKRRLIEQFFEQVQCNDTYREVFGRKDSSGCAEQYVLYDKISAAKEQAKAAAMGQQFESNEEAQHIMTQYQHHNKVYFVKESDDGKFRIYFYYMMNPPSHIPIGDIPPCDAKWIAQKMLDDYAQRREFEVYDPDFTGKESPELEQQTFGDSPEENDDSVPDFDDDPDMEQEDKTTESVNDNHSGLENPDESENDDGEAPPNGCSWQNASGGESTSPPEDDDTDEISGAPLSLRGSEFDAIISTADGVLNRLVSMLHAKKQRDGEMTIKVTSEDLDGSYLFSGAVSGKINYTVKPQKIVGDAMELRFDLQGNPIIPYDREHQLSFDEIPPAVPVVTQVDSSTGLVEKVTVKEDEDLEPEPETDQDDQDENNYPDELYPCNCFECKFFAVPDYGDAGCCFDSEDPESGNYAGDVWEAVHMHGCQRQEVLHAYRQNDPDREDYDDVPDNSDDQEDI